MKPSLSALRKVVTQQWELKNHDPDSAIKSQNWNVTKCMEWLKYNPITGKIDVTFLELEVSSYKELALSTTGDTEQGKQW